jgi:hypothetical protein
LIGAERFAGRCQELVPSATICHARTKFWGAEGTEVPRGVKGSPQSKSSPSIDHSRVRQPDIGA